MSDRRRYPRTRKRLRVLYGESDLGKVGFTRDVSAGGMFIICNGPLPLGTRLHVQVFLNDKEFLLLEAVQIHNKQVPPALRTSSEQGFAVRFLTPMEALARVAPAPEEVAEVAAVVVSAPPVPDRPSFAVEYPLQEDLKAAWQRELRFGGVFAPTGQVLERDQLVSIHMRMPFAGLNLEVSGRVLQASAGAAPGLSLGFADPSRIWQVLSPLVGD